MLLIHSFLADTYERSRGLVWVYVIVAFLSYKLTFRSWNMNIDKTSNHKLWQFIVPNYSLVNLIEYIIKSTQL